MQARKLAQQDATAQEGVLKQGEPPVTKEDAGTQAPLIRVRNLEYAYPGKAPVFTDVNLEVVHGEVSVLLGPNGAGK